MQVTINPHDVSLAELMYAKHASYTDALVEMDSHAQDLEFLIQGLEYFLKEALEMEDPEEIELLQETEIPTLMAEFNKRVNPSKSIFRR
jgi:hypothetical protein